MSQNDVIDLTDEDRSCWILVASFLSEKGKELEAQKILGEHKISMKLS